MRKSSVFLNQRTGPIRSLSGLKQAVGWVPVPRSGRASFPFPVSQVGRTNLTGNATLNGYASGAKNDISDYASSDILSAGLYQFDWTISATNPTNDQVELYVYDRGDNVVTHFTVWLVQGGAAPVGLNQINRMDLPVAEGQRIALRRTASNTNNMFIAMSWRFLNPYLGNTPLSLAAQSVQRSEPTSLGQSTIGQTINTVPAFQGTEPYSGATEGSGAGDGGGDGGPSE